MARDVWEVNGGAWAKAKGLWGKHPDTGAWSVAKKAWNVKDGAWAPCWPPTLAFDSFNVVATTGEVGYTTSEITWAITTSVPGSVTIQSQEPGGSWTDMVKNLANSGSTTEPLAPTKGAGGTWSYRAVFIPTYDTDWLTYSSTDTVDLTIPSITFSVTETTGEVYYTYGNLSWTTTSSLAGTVMLQRKKGSGGTWTDWMSTPSQTGTGIGQLTPAGTSQNATWYYRARFTTTVDPTWSVYSSEDSVAISYRSRTSPSGTAINCSLTYTASSFYTNYTPIKNDNGNLCIDVFGMTAQDRSDVSSLSASCYGWEGIYVYHDGAIVYTSVGQTNSTVVNVSTTSCASVDETLRGTVSGQYRNYRPIDWGLWVTDPGAYDNCPTYPGVYGIGFNYGPNNVTTTVTFSDGNTLSTNSTYTGRNGGNTV